MWGRRASFQAGQAECLQKGEMACTRTPAPSVYPCSSVRRRRVPVSFGSLARATHLIMIWNLLRGNSGSLRASEEQECRHPVGRFKSQTASHASHVRAPTNPQIVPQTSLALVAASQQRCRPVAVKENPAALPGPAQEDGPADHSPSSAPTPAQQQEKRLCIALEPSLLCHITLSSSGCTRPDSGRQNSTTDGFLGPQAQQAMPQHTCV